MLLKGSIRNSRRKNQTGWRYWQERRLVIGSGFICINGVTLAVKPVGKVGKNLPFFKELAYKFTQKLDSTLS